MNIDNKKRLFIKPVFVEEMIITQLEPQIKVTIKPE